MLRFVLALFIFGCLTTGSAQDYPSYVVHEDHEDVVLEPWTYKSDFEYRTLGAWASYTLWQDIAYDPNFRTNEIVPGDPNISIVQRVTPYTNVDNYAGAQKLLDMYLVPGAEVSFRYYLKTSDNAEYFKVRFAGGEYGKLDVTIPAPEMVDVKSEVHPHYLNTLNRVRPLERSGMLTLTARTSRTHGFPLVIANLFTTTGGEAPDVSTQKGTGFVRGVASGVNFSFSTRPGRLYEIGNVITDALAYTWNGDRILVASTKDFRENGWIVIQSNEPVTFERNGGEINYYLTNDGELSIGVSSRPSTVRLNGSNVQNVNYNSERRVIVIEIPAGEGEIIIE